MATHDVPGANPANKDVLAAMCWAEHEDGSLILVKGTEGGRVVYEIYDVASDPPVFYQDAMAEDGFKTQFSWPNKSGEKWTWHDKTPFPWDRVMTAYDRPVPQPTSAQDALSAAQRIAESLRLRAQRLSEADVQALGGTERPAARTIMDRIADAIDAFNK